MKDKIFVTFLCATLCVVTNAMGDVGDGVRNCRVQAEVRPGDAERYGEGDDTYVWLKGDLLFISDNEALRCGGGFCDEGVDFKFDDEKYGFRCTVTGGTGEWQKVELGVDIPFCEDSEINVFGVKNSVYSYNPIGIGETFHAHRFVIGTKAFCVYSKCEEDHEYFNGKCVLPECKQLIESGKATGWDDENNACLCNDTANAEWRYKNCVCKDTVNAKMDDDGKCVCKDTVNAKMDDNGKCVCKDTNAKMDDDGKCVCKDEEMEFDDDGNCVKKDVDGVGNCKVQEGVTRSDDAVEYKGSGGDTVWLKGEFLFISDNEALQCGGDFCDNGVEFTIFAENDVFRCAVTGGTGEWQYAKFGSDIPFCDDSEIKELNVQHAEYDLESKGGLNDLYLVDEARFVIGAKGYCVYSECIEGYGVVVDDNGDYVCKKQAGGDNEIEQLGKWLDTETEKFERSKWRDAEGKFNTARLASDSIAGVVLGTAGGLISSKVIKKKQVENGFEDIKCTIGSQEVADWGDEFQVGIQ